MDWPTSSSKLTTDADLAERIIARISDLMESQAGREILLAAITNMPLANLFHLDAMTEHVCIQGELKRRPLYQQLKGKYTWR